MFVLSNYAVFNEAIILECKRPWKTGEEENGEKGGLGKKEEIFC